LVPRPLSPPEQYSIFIVPPSSIQALTLIKKKLGKILLMFQEIFKESVEKSREIREYLFIYEEAKGYLFMTLQPIPFQNSNFFLTV
jgi:hypothetical protein